MPRFLRIKRCLLVGASVAGLAGWAASVPGEPVSARVPKPVAVAPAASETLASLAQRHPALAAVYEPAQHPLTCQHGGEGAISCAMYAPRFRPGRAFQDTPNATGSSEFSTVPGARWPQPGGRGSPVEITYSYSNLLDGGMTGVTTTELQNAVEEALELWASVAPLEFVEVTDSGSPVNDNSYPASGEPNLRFGHHEFDGSGSVLAHAYFPLSTSTAGLSGDLHFDNGESWDIEPGPGKIDFLEVCVHELGHSLGLNHQNPPRQAIMNPYYGERFLGPGTAFLFRDDRRGITRIYGPALSGGSITQNLLDGNLEPLLSVAVRRQLGW